MHKDRMLLPPRQQRLAFAEDEVWRMLPDEVRGECHARIAQLLQTVIRADREPRSVSHEREDPT